MSILYVLSLHLAYTKFIVNGSINYSEVNLLRVCCTIFSAVRKKQLRNCYNLSSPFCIFSLLSVSQREIEVMKDEGIHNGAVNKF